MSATEVIVLLVALAWAFTVFYWAVVRPYMMEAAAFERARLISDLDWALIEGKEGAQGRAAQLLRSSLECDASQWVSFSHVLVCGMFFRSQNMAEAERNKEAFRNAPEWLLRIRTRLVMARVKTILANSPTWWPMFAAILLGAYFSQTVAAWREKCLAALAFSSPISGTQHA